jgi:hypothetical protein
MKYVSDLSAMKDEDRTKLANNLIAMTTSDSANNLSKAETMSIAKLGHAMNDKVDASTISGLLDNVHRATLKSRPGVAIVLGEWSIDQKVTDRTDDMVILENNEIIGIVSLYEARPVLGERVINELLAKLQSPWKEYKDWTISGLQGALAIKGNRMVGVTVGKDIIDSLQKPADAENRDWTLNIFARCLLSENVIEGISLIISQDLALTTNDFAMNAVVTTAGQVIQVGGAIADSSVYVGNQGYSTGISWRDVSHVSERTANARMNIV